MLPNVAINTTAAQEHVREISQRDNEYSPIPSITKAHDNLADAFLHHVDERISGEVGCLQKMEPKRTYITSQARCQVTLQDSF